MRGPAIKRTLAVVALVLSGLAAPGARADATEFPEIATTQSIRPGSLAVTPAGDVYFVDFLHHEVIHLHENGSMGIVAGNGSNATGSIVDEENSTTAPSDGAVALETALLPAALAYHGGALYITSAILRIPNGAPASVFDVRVIKVDGAGRITTVAGGGPPGVSGDGGPATSARIEPVNDVVFDHLGDMLLSSTSAAGTGHIRLVTPGGTMLTYWDDTLGVIATRGGTRGIGQMFMASDGSVLLADGQRGVDQIFPGGKVGRNIAGNGLQGDDGDGGPSILSALRDPQGVAQLSNGSVFISDVDEPRHRLRVVDRSGFITSLPGMPEMYVLETSSDGGRLITTGPCGIYTVTSSGALTTLIAADCS